MKKLFTFWLIGLWVITACSPVGTPQDVSDTSASLGDRENDSTALDRIIKPEDDEEDEDDTDKGTLVNDSSSTDPRLVLYENKAVGYTILRPDLWYWQHFIKSEIGEHNPFVDDYFITDRNPLLGLGSEYLGQIVIEVSQRPLEAYAEGVAGFSMESGSVGGVEANRYATTRNNDLVQNQQVIEYQFVRGGKTFRIIYSKIESTPEEESLFENMVESLKFTR